MSRIRRVAVSTLAVLTLAGGATLLASDAPPSEAGAAFDKMKSLVGRWEAKTAQGNTAVATYELVANGSALLERYHAPEHGTMITLYHLDGDALALTHYCMAGNQPRMRAARYDAGKQELRFEFVGAGNLKSPSDGHMHEAVFRFDAKDQFTTQWAFFKGGSSVNTEVSTFKRVS